jgi:streptogramin lyase
MLVLSIGLSLSLFAAIASGAVGAEPTIEEFSDGISAEGSPNGITAGPDGNVWFTEFADRIGRITPTGSVTEFSTGITSNPEEIAAGPDGNLWFTENNGDRIGRITPTGSVTEFSAGISPNSYPLGIAAGPDGNLWFTEAGGSRIGRVTPTGVVTEFSAGITSATGGITAGPDGNVWFTAGGDRIGRITPVGVVTEFSTGLTGGPTEIAAGPDGNLWFTENTGDRIGRITPTGSVTEFSAGISPNSYPLGIAAGPDGNLWFTENTGDRIGRVSIKGPPPAPPHSTSPPTISGSVRVWQTLSCTQGGWTSPLLLTYAYQWRRDGAAISGATGSTYVVEEADAGHTLSCEVIATNGVGSTHVTSAAVSVPARKPPSSSSCPDVVIYGARGSGEDNTAANVGMGPVSYAIGQEIINRLPAGHRVEMIGVNYPAVPATALVNYEWSVVTGTEVLVEGDNGHGGLVSLVLKCPQVAVVLVGLSQGAHVIHYTLSLAPPHPSAVTRRIAASLLFGDPVRQPNQSYNVTNQAAKGVLLGFTPLPGNSGPPNIVSNLQPATQSYCLPYDPICDSTGALEPGGFVIYRTIHDGYGSSPYIADAASFAVNRINVMLGHAATAAARTGVAATAARASKAHRKHAGHRCNRRQADPFDATSVCPHATHGVRPQRRSTYKGSSRDRDVITMTASRNAAKVSVKVVDRCGTVFSGTIAVTRGGVFDGTTPEGFEITGLFANKRIVRGTLTDPSCKSLPIRSFTLRRRGH